VVQAPIRSGQLSNFAVEIYLRIEEYHCTFQACIMPAKSRFTRLDAFTKTVEDARIRTTSGGVVTIASLLVILYLIWGEWSDYRKIIVQPELIVDKGRGESLARLLHPLR
jgi:Endoplasmic Reticulum-Golgi Intermediate Compartment (ERGIC)